MLNRRHIRVKVLQSLFSFFLVKEDDLERGERAMFKSVDKIYEMYLYLLLTFYELHKHASYRVDENKKKKLPSEKDLQPNLNFINNKVLTFLSENDEIIKLSEKYKVNWTVQESLIKKCYENITSSELYTDYLAKDVCTLEEDKEFMIDVFKQFIANFTPLQEYFFEKSIFWQDDLDLCCVAVIKTIRSINDNGKMKLLGLYKNPVEDRNYVKELFRQTVLQKKENTDLIIGKTQNWEVDRIALIDIILMQMALTEAKVFNQIPIKVTLNEYIEIAKFYSTSKSDGFINGILDKLIADLQLNGKIKKIGRGLL